MIIASSFEQARIAFETVQAYVDPDELKDRRKFRLWDSAQLARIECREHNTRVRCLASDPRRMHGIQPVLVLADEPSQWESSKSDKAYAALQTSMGKIPDARLIALGTRPIGSEHWFQQLLDGGADYSQSHHAKRDDPPLRESTWRKANPSLRYMPILKATVKREAIRAKRNPDLLPMFKAYRLNLGVSDVSESLLLDPDVWERSESDVDRTGRFALGLDLGSSAAMSAASAYWPETGRLESLACFPELPELDERGALDGVGRMYSNMAERGELIQAGQHVSDVGELLRAVLVAWGVPGVIIADRWREAELRQSLEEIRFPQTQLVTRGQGFKDGSEDVREFRKACLSGLVRPEVSLLMRSAMSEARVVIDPAGNAKLAKNTEGGRRLRARDDAAAAAILAVAEGSRKHAVWSKDTGPLLFEVV